MSVPTAKEMMQRIEDSVLWDSEGELLTEWRKQIEQEQRERTAASFDCTFFEDIDEIQAHILEAKEGVKNGNKEGPKVLDVHPPKA